ncbi:TPA: relaxase/mobilization nuclease domain-containing protein [Streptococcus suis]|nr:relaxase/mobilization nuclease domain-containing protein [Streptococcus suis]
MVVTKVLQIRKSERLSKAIKYVEDEAKTVDQSPNQYLENATNYIQNETKTVLSDEERYLKLVSGHGIVSVDTAFDEFMMTKLQANQVLGRERSGTDVLAHHIIQSFSPEDDLSPQEIHEIGRKTVLELTGGQHEFIIATHIDKGHIHNHIIFNNTNSVTLKKFRWQKGTKRSLENISDKHAALAGAKIIDKSMKNSRREYLAYRQKNSHRFEIKERLNFLLKHSVSLEDFLEKARMLNLQIDTSRKEVRYKLLDRDQERFVRDRTLSKKGLYSLEKIQERLAQNSLEVPTETIKVAYEQMRQERDQDFEMKIRIHDWQVLDETEQGLYIEVEYGLTGKGQILIPAQYIDKQEEGYDIYIKKSDWFYFTDPNHADKNRFMKGDILAQQLSYDNGELIINKHPYIGRMNQLVREFNYLSAHGVTDSQEFRQLQVTLRETAHEVEQELDKLDAKLAQLNKLQSALLATEQENPQQKELAQDILKALRLSSTVSKAQVDKLVQEVTIERGGLRERFEQLDKDFRQYGYIEKNVRERERRQTSSLEL